MNDKFYNFFFLLFMDGCRKYETLAWVLSPTLVHGTQEE